MAEQPESDYTDIQPLLADLRAVLEVLYGDRLVLCSSPARRAAAACERKELPKNATQADDNERRRACGRAALSGCCPRRG